MKEYYLRIKSHYYEELDHEFGPYKTLKTVKKWMKGFLNDDLAKEYLNPVIVKINDNHFQIRSKYKKGTLIYEYETLMR